MSTEPSSVASSQPAEEGRGEREEGRLPGMVDWGAPVLAAATARWRATQPAVKATVTKALQRCYLARPGSEVSKHGEEGKRTVRRKDGSTWQQSIDETVQWEHTGGRWELVLPWQVVNKLRQIEHHPLIAVAKPAREEGDLAEEDRIAVKLMEVAGRLMAEVNSGRGHPLFGEPTVRLVRALAQQYRNMPVQGRRGINEATGCRHSFYYTWEQLQTKEKAKGEEKVGSCLEDWSMRLAAAQAAHDHELAWVCQMFLKGRPVRISNFFIEPLHSLLKADGKTYLRVFLIHTAARTYGPLEIAGEDYHSPSYLRRWLNSHAGGVWHAGEKELQLVMEDCSLVFDQKEVREISVFGWHAESRAWFTPTAAMDCRGELRMPDKSGVFTVPVPRKDGNGWKHQKYRLSDKDKDGFNFALGAPDWKPKWRITDGDLTQWEQDHGFKKFTERGVRASFAELAWRLHDMLGGYNAYMGLGWVFACLAAPEVFEKYRAFPGLWIHGEVKQGKSTAAEVYMRCLGYPCSPAGVSLESSTGAGGETVMQQYSQLPAWFEEAQNSTKETLLVVLKAGFNRHPPQKRVTNLREVLTSPLVVGITTCGDAQIRSRYPHQLVSERQRLPLAGDAKEQGAGSVDTPHPGPLPSSNEGRGRKTGTPHPGPLPSADEGRGGGTYSPLEASKAQNANYDWIAAHKEEFVLFGRLILAHRETFAARVMELLEEWMRADDTHGLDARAKLVHGICYAAWLAATEQFGLRELRFREVRQVDGVKVAGQQFGPVAVVAKRFRRAMIDASRISAADVAEAAELDRFFKLVTTAFALKAFGETKAEWQTFFKVRLDEKAPVHAPGTLPEAEQNRGIHSAWRSYHLYLRPDRVCMALREFLRKQNETLPLREDELRRQMAVKPYWLVDLPEKVRFGPGQENKIRKFWGLKLDEMEGWGYRPLPDEDPELQQWLAQGVEADPWEDPRRSGYLYEIVKAMERRGGEPEP